MLSFSKEQEIVEVAGVRMGGQPGELPTVLFGTIFYRKQFREVGSEAVSRVEALVARQAEMSDMTGVPMLGA